MRRWTLSAGTALLAAALLAAGCSSSSKSTGQAATTVAAPSTTASAGASTTVAAATSTVWLCKPGLTPNPCLNSLATTKVTADGTRTVVTPTPKPATNPKIDCFYVYPTVSEQKTKVANLHIDPAEISVANAQASRFSQTCRVFAPMYRQGTLVAIGGGGTGKSDRNVGFTDVETAWNDYLQHDNDGRGVVLIGHSQGAFVLTALIKKDIDNNPAERKLLVSALLLGGNVMVPQGKDVGGSFQHVPACRTTTQTGCVVAYSSFLETPPAASLFGKGAGGMQVLCVNPAAPAGGSAPLDSFYPTRASLLGGGLKGSTGITTPWVELPEMVTGQCKTSGNSTWLQVTPTAGTPAGAPYLTEPLGPTWGLHLVDVNVAYGNLVSMVQQQSGAYHP
jgi:hypothetical protein